MGCLVVASSLIAPRLVLLVMWLVDYLAASFTSWFWPTLGFFVAPTTTIAYAVAKQELSTDAGAITAAGVVVIAVGVVMDLGLLGNGARSRRRSG